MFEMSQWNRGLSQGLIPEWRFSCGFWVYVVIEQLYAGASSSYSGNLCLVENRRSFVTRVQMRKS